MVPWQTFISSDQSSSDGQRIVDDVKTSMTHVDGQHQVSLPLKRRQNPNDSYAMVLKRLVLTEKRLLKEQKVAEEYTSSRVFQPHLDCGYVSKVWLLEQPERTGWYLPHFAVTRPDASTTKVCIVFDASAKCAGSCLNDFMHQGPKLQRDLSTVLLRFRSKPIALVANVKERKLNSINLTSHSNALIGML